MTFYDKINQILRKTQSAKPFLIEIGEKVLKTCNAPLEINLGIIKYDIKNKLIEEVNKLPEAVAIQALREIKEVIEKWQNHSTT